MVKTTCFLADIADFAAFNEVYAKFFTSKPARSCVAVERPAQGRPVRDRGHRRGVSARLISSYIAEKTRTAPPHRQEVLVFAFIREPDALP